MKKRIVITTEFIASHAWFTCNLPDVGYLKNEHRHRFTVCMKWDVMHNDREIEFISMKALVDVYISETFTNRFLENMSCEDIAQNLFLKFNPVFISIFEDGENGAEIEI